VTQSHPVTINHFDSAGEFALRKFGTAQSHPVTINHFDSLPDFSRGGKPVKSLN